MKVIALAFTACMFSALPRAHADDEFDVAGAEYLDVVETTDGSIWKGIVVEQTPNVSYKIATADGSLHVIKASDVVKISRQRNKSSHPHVVAADPPNGSDAGPDLTRHYEPGGGGLPAPYAKSGLRIEPSLAFVFPAGDIKMINTTFSPSVSAGYEVLLGNFGLEGGGLTRFSYWQLPGGTGDAAWTLETMAYARAALHISRVALHAGVAVGLDTNYVFSSQANMAKTALGFGMNVGGGLDVAATPTVALHAGFDYHPGTDTVVDGLPGSISYYALLVGASLRL